MSEVSPPRAAAPNRRVSRRWLGVFALLAIVLISYVDRVNVSVLVTDRAFTEHFGMTGDRGLQGALMTVFLVGYGVAAFVLTPLYEAVLGVRRGLLVSVLCWSVFTLVSPYALGALMLVVFRVLLGAAEGPLFSLKTMYIKGHFAPEQVGKPNAVSSMGVSLGTAVGLPLVTFLVYHFTWHASFLILALLNACVGLPLILLFVRDARGVHWRDGAPTDTERDERRQGRRPSDGRATATRGTARRGARKDSWATVREALRTPRLIWILLIEIASLAYLWGSSSWLPSYLLDERHFSLSQMGLVSSLPFLMSLGSGFLSGYLIDRIPAHRVPTLFAVGSVGTGLSVLLVINSASVWLAATGLILANGFWGLQAPAIPTLVQHHTRQAAVGTAYGIVNGAGNLISAFMPTAMGLAISLSGHGFAAGYSLLIGTQVVTLTCSIRLLLRPVRPWEISGEAESQVPHSSARNPVVTERH